MHCSPAMQESGFEQGLVIGRNEYLTGDVIMAAPARLGLYRHYTAVPINL